MASACSRVSPMSAGSPLPSATASASSRCRASHYSGMASSLILTCTLR